MEDGGFLDDSGLHCTRGRSIQPSVQKGQECEQQESKARINVYRPQPTQILAQPFSHNAQQLHHQGQKESTQAQRHQGAGIQGRKNNIDEKAEQESGRQQQGVVIQRFAWLPRGRKRVPAAVRTPSDVNFNPACRTFMHFWLPGPNSFSIVYFCCDACTAIPRCWCSNHHELSRITPEPLDDEMITDLMRWRGETRYAKEGDWIFASNRMKGRQPLWPEAITRNYIRPAAQREQLAKSITWHVFATRFRRCYTRAFIDTDPELVETWDCRTTSAGKSALLRSTCG
jgi:hypothetical protein